jgi:hypothetical protein
MQPQQVKSSSPANAGIMDLMASLQYTAINSQVLHPAQVLSLPGTTTSPALLHQNLPQRPPVPYLPPATASPSSHRPPLAHQGTALSPPSSLSHVTSLHSLGPSSTVYMMLLPVPTKMNKSKALLSQTCFLSQLPSCHCPYLLLHATSLFKIRNHFHLLTQWPVLSLHLTVPS